MIAKQLYYRNTFNGTVGMNRTTSMPKSVLHYVRDKVMCKGPKLKSQPLYLYFCSVSSCTQNDVTLVLLGWDDQCPQLTVEG